MTRPEDATSPGSLAEMLPAASGQAGGTQVGLARPTGGAIVVGGNPTQRSQLARLAGMLELEPLRTVSAHGWSPHEVSAGDVILFDARGSLGREVPVWIAAARKDAPKSRILVVGGRGREKAQVALASGADGYLGANAAVSDAVLATKMSALLLARLRPAAKPNSD